MNIMSFKQFIEERMVDPVALANRAAKRFGKKKSYGPWMKTEKGQHIPLKYNGRKAYAAGNRLYNVQKKLGMYDIKTQEEGQRKFAALHKRETMNIKDLHATQPFVRTGDQEKLKSKVAETNPQHIHVITHKGEHFIADGHHAVMAARLRGEKTVSVLHTNLDEVK